MKVLKIKESTSRISKDKVEVVRVAENYREALEMVEKLNRENKNHRITYKTGDIVYKPY